MKINKILAAGIAATLAVTSLATVAGAEIKSQIFDMETTLGKITYKPNVSGEQNVTPGDDFKYNEKVAGTADTFKFAAAAVKEANVDTNIDGVMDYRDVDAFIPLTVRATTADGVALYDKIGTLTITISGKKLGAIAGTQEPEVQKITLMRADALDDTAGIAWAAGMTRAAAVTAGAVAIGTGANYILPVYLTDAPGDAFIPERFVSIDNIKVDASGASNIDFSNLQKDVYTKVKKLIDDDKGRNLQVNANNTEQVESWNYDRKAAKHNVGYWMYTGADLKAGFNTDGTLANTNDAKVTISLADGIAAHDISFTTAPPAAASGTKIIYQVTGSNGGVKNGNIIPVIGGTPVALAAAGTNAKVIGTVADRGGDLVNEVNTLLAQGIEINWKASEASTTDHKAFIDKTTDNTIIYRDDVWALSYADAYRATTHAALSNGITTDINQSYYDNGLGDQPRYFGGLASQCADFFNKQKNGKIIFTFTANASTDSWKSGGIPSTEVGLKNALAGTAMALFFNYDQSTGSLNTIGEVDTDKCTITFDISNILDDMGGWTKGNISDIYYGLNKGLAYNDALYGKARVGYIVEKVELQYDDAAATVDAAADDDDAAAVVVADDDDDDDVIADDDFDDDDIIADDDDDDYDDDDDAGIIEDDDDDDTDVNNDVDYVDGDDDANPGTGVGLAVIPAIVAAAAVVVSKKRK